MVNASTIRIRFENDRVRVLEATIPPGLKEQVHSHPAYLIYVLEGGKYRNYAADGKVTEGAFQDGEVIYREPLTHAAENIGDKPIHLILVELKKCKRRPETAFTHNCRGSCQLPVSLSARDILRCAALFPRKTASTSASTLTAISAGASAPMSRPNGA